MHHDISNKKEVGYGSKHDVVDTMDDADDTELVPARVLYWMNQEDDEATACVPEPASPLYHAWSVSRDE